jgi:hypothetical protein
LVVAFALVCFTTVHVTAADAVARRSAAGIRDGVADYVGLFEAMEAGEVEARLILQDETAGRIIVTNKTKQPLTVKLPQAFAGAPVLAQIGWGPNFGNNNNNNNGGGNQAVGAGIGQGNNVGFFAIEPEKAVKIKVVAVCLEHGKKEPNPHVAYRVLPLEEYTSDAKVIDVVRSLGRGELDQKAAQAAAWHLANGLSWKQLAAKIGVRHIGGRTERFFTPSQLERALAATQHAASRAEQAAATQSIGGE